MRRAAALALCLVWPAPLAAQDWLVALEPAPGAAPGLALYYPRAELPALVAAGDVLSARLQLAAAMTPPPGVAQARALAGFAAELRGDGLPLTAAGVHRHRLRVLALQPEDGTSLSYRVLLRVPAYVAPGTYAFELTTPFGARASLRAVRVLARGEPPRVARCPQALQVRAPVVGPELGGLPVDVWLCPGDPARLPDAPAGLGLTPAPELHPLAVAGRFALRVGPEVWRFGAGQGAPAFERALAAEGRALLQASLPEVPRLPAAALEPVRVVRTPRGLEVMSPVDRQLVLLVPADSAVHATGPLALYPATDLRLRAAPALLVLAEVRGGQPARLELRPAEPPAPAPSVSARAAPTELRIPGARRDAQVAFELGDQTALVGANLTLTVTTPAPGPARALVMSRTAGAQLLRRQVRLEARRPPSCSLRPAPRAPGWFGPALLCGWASLLKIRRRRGLGNRLRPDVRCELRHGALY